MITRKLFDSIFSTIGLTSPEALRKYNLIRRRDELIAALNKFLPVYEINTHLRICAFLSNCGIETDYFKTTTEYADGWDYDISVNPKKARELGNFKKGDGPHYKGSGLSQTTGGYNFQAVQNRIGKRLGIDVVKNPELLRDDIEIAVESACIFWRDHNLNQYADRGEFQALSAIVNRGDKDLMPLRWAKRNELYSLCKRRVPKDFSFASSPLPIAIVSTPLPTQISDTGIVLNRTAGVLTPTEEDSSFDLPDLDLDTAKQHLSDGVEIVKRPGVKTLLSVLVTKFGFYFTLVWESGWSGKVLLVIGGLLILSSIAYTIYYYRVQIKSGFSKIKAAVVKAVKKKTSNENS